MSLLNNMLKNLEGAKNPSSLPSGDPDVTSIPGRGLRATTSTPKKPNKAHIKLLLLLCLIIAAFFLLKKHPLYKKPAPLPKPTVTASPPSSSSMNITESFVRLANIKMARMNNQTTLQFITNKTLVYDYKAISSSVLNLKLINTRFQQKLPAIPPDIGIKKITTQPAQNDLVVTIELFPNAHVDKINPAEDRVEFLISLQENQLNTAAPPPPEEETVDAKYENIMKKADQRSPEDMIELLSNLLEKYPYFLPPRLSLTILLLQQNDLLSAQKHLSIGLKNQPSSIELITLQARLYIIQKEFKKALDLLNTIHPNIPDARNYYAIKAFLYRQVKQFNLAGEIYEALIKLDPENPAWWLGLAITLEKTDHINSAVESYRRTASLSALNPSLQLYAKSQLQRLEGGN